MAVSNEANMYSVKSDLYLAMGQPQQALDVLLSPDCIQASSSSYGADYKETSRKMGLASVYGRLGKFDKMLELANSISDANNARAIKAVAYTLQNNLAAATEQAHNITDREGNRKEMLLSCIYSKQGKFEQALKYADAAREKRADLAWLEQRLFLLNKLGRYKEVLSDSNNFNSFLTWHNWTFGIIGKIPSIHADRAQAFWRLGQAKQALAEAQLALSLNPNSMTALHVAADASKALADQAAAAAYEARIKALGEIPIYR
jgi:tetratricopeptide (TPR) repeat protein